MISIEASGSMNFLFSPVAEIVQIPDPELFQEIRGKSDVLNMCHEITLFCGFGSDRFNIPAEMRSVAGRVKCVATLRGNHFFIKLQR